MGEGIKPIYDNLASFKKKYYLNLFIRGTILTLSLILIYFIIASLLEYNLWMSKGARLLVFASFIVLVLFCVYRFLKLPLRWWVYKRGLGQEESAQMVGRHFPTISDRLLNLLQLASLPGNSELVQAGIAQKSRAMQGISFEEAIDLRENRKYLKYFAVPFVLMGILWVIDQNIFTQSTKRIVQFNTEFSPEAPFQFVVPQENLVAFFNEDYTLQLRLDGDVIPESAYIVSGRQRLKMEQVKPGEFAYTFERIQAPMTFQFEASGFFSSNYTIELVNRPELTELKIDLSFPRYLGRKSEQLTNTGNLEIPEGTKVTWTVGGTHAKSASMAFGGGPETEMQLVGDQLFTFGNSFFNPQDYWISLENERAKNKDKIAYSIRVIKDQHPDIVVDHVRDSVLFKTVLLGGSIADDYGLTRLELRYNILKEGKREPSKEKSLNLPLNSSSNQQSFFHQWVLDSLDLQPGDQLNYYMQVWDNDGVNGHKATKSATYVFALPGEDEMKAEISKSQAATQGKIDRSLNKAKEMRESIEEAQQKLRGKQSLDWQDKKMLEDLVQQKSSLDQLINELQKENRMLDEKKNAFSEEESERIKEKSEQIQKLMDELLDEETKKLFEELEKLLKENSDPSQIQRMLEKMDRKGNNLEKELERMLELAKQMQRDYKLEQAINELKEQTERQEQLQKETEAVEEQKNKEQRNAEQKKEGKEGKKGKDSKEGEQKEGEEQENNEQKDAEQQNNEQQNSGQQKDQNQQGEDKSLDQKQEDLAKDFEDFEKAVEELNELDKQLEEESGSPSQEEMNQVKDAQQQSKQSLQKGQSKQSSQQQQKAVKQMKQMQQQMESMQSDMQMEIDMQNMESLRQIIHGLIKLSFDQENLMKEFVPIQQTDPKYVQLGQDQLKIKDDAKILEDSLLALAKKDAFMSSVVTKEVGELNTHMDKAVENVRERRKGNAGTEMQLSMTSINNLALMLKDHFDMMQQMMANAMKMPGKGKSGKQKGQQMNLGEMQQQLNQRIQQLKNGGMKGRELSEELARVAAEQERIRRALQEMQEKLKREGGKVPGGDLPGKMEQTEMDLVNKQITEQTIRRQQEIMTRLLETEKSLREQNMDDERKGETAKDYDKEIPRAFEEYLRLKEKEVELLKTVPPKLYPYYKKEVNDYFKRIGTQE
ncbi:MAG TPA: DUF4175 family protein [Cyclobacteriaceae bacterium]|nr:DUF4175 family protein [Cyclobacteriaceae bacterium]